MKRLTDEQLHELASEYRRLKAEARADEVLADSHRDAIVAELQARKAVTAQVGDLRIKLATSRKVVSLDEARAKLGPRRVKQFIREQIDKKKWDAAIEAGKLAADVAESCIVEEPVTPHIYVNPVKAA